MLRFFYRWLIKFVGAESLYQQIVVDDCFTDVPASVRKSLVELLSSINVYNPFFEGRFTDFLNSTSKLNDAEFFAEYAKIPALSKQDYAEAGLSVMARPWCDAEPDQLDLQVNGNLWDSIGRLRRGQFLMSMATGGSTSLPLLVRMTKTHTLSMLFTFFKCWYRMGWRPGDRLLIFYPRNTYNIDDMAKFNRLSWLVGFRYHLFERIDEPTVRNLVAEINRFKPKLLLVFPSPMNMVAQTIRRLTLKVQHCPELINVSGETFFDCQRANIQSIFPHSRIEDSFGSVELGEFAHEAQEGGLEVFSKVAYVETETNAAGRPELVITRLGLTDFPFVRYRMRDIAQIELRRDASGREKWLLTNIEGKDANFIVAESGERIYPSFFNRMINEVNCVVEGSIVEIKVVEQDQSRLDIQFILRDSKFEGRVELLTKEFLRSRLSAKMDYQIRFVDYIDHDYRRKYRVIERLGELEFAGGMVGDRRKQSLVSSIESRCLIAGEKDGRNEIGFAHWFNE